MELKDRVALVTGGSRGIGRACALELAKLGAHVVISYQGNEVAAAETVKLITAMDRKSKAIRFDISDTKAGSDAVDSVVKEFGRLDILVNNAGISIDGLSMRFKDEDWDKTLDTNLKGTFSMCRAATRPMMKQRSGSIINLTSVIGEMGNAGQIAYSASKAGIIGLTKSFARELAPRKIRVNAVSPGFITTDMTSEIPQEAQDKILQIIPLARLGQSEEVAHAVAFLATDKSAYITGEVLKVNGGMYM